MDPFVGMKGSLFPTVRLSITLPALLTGCLSFAVVGHAQGRLPAGPGRDTMKKVCSACHSAENVVGMGKTRDEWGKVVSVMVENGAQGTEDQFNEVVDYLAEHFPKTINVNKAPQQDLQASLGLQSAEAEAIVHYREEKGSIKSVDDLEKIPGVDAKKIEAKKDRLLF